MSNLVKQSIIDKNGTPTSRWVNPNKSGANLSRDLPAVPAQPKPLDTNQRGLTYAKHEALRDILAEMPRSEKFHLESDDFVDTVFADNYPGEHWFSDGVHSYKLLGLGTQYSPFHIIPSPPTDDVRVTTVIDRANEEIAALFGTKPPYPLTPYVTSASPQSHGISFLGSKGETIVASFDGLGLDKPSSAVNPMVTYRDGRENEYRISYAGKIDEPYELPDYVTEYATSEDRKAAYDKLVEERGGADGITIYNYYKGNDGTPVIVTSDQLDDGSTPDGFFLATTQEGKFFVDEDYEYEIKMKLASDRDERYSMNVIAVEVIDGEVFVTPRGEPWNCYGTEEAQSFIADGW